MIYLFKNIKLDRKSAFKMLYISIAFQIIAILSIVFSAISPSFLFTYFEINIINENLDYWTIWSAIPGFLANLPLISLSITGYISQYVYLKSKRRTHFWLVGYGVVFAIYLLFLHKYVSKILYGIAGLSMWAISADLNKWGILLIGLQGLSDSIFAISIAFLICSINIGRYIND